MTAVDEAEFDAFGVGADGPHPVSIIAVARPMPAAAKAVRLYFNFPPGAMA
jgi:hypothetical protein